MKCKISINEQTKNFSATPIYLSTLFFCAPSYTFRNEVM